MGMVSRTSDAERAWHLLLVTAGIAHVLVGFTFLLTSNQLEGPVLGRAGSIPNPVWGLAAVIAGVLICVPVARFAGLVATSVWYAVWAAFVIVGVLENNGPFYAVPVYLFLIVLHSTFAVIDFCERDA